MPQLHAYGSVARVAYVLILGLCAVPAAGQQVPAATPGGGRFWADLRYRYETVEQDNALRNARASTLRARAGYETARHQGFGALLEAEAVVSIGNDAYNSTVNGRTGYSIIADPQASEINRAYLSYNGFPRTTMSYGRQRITLDNQRFIGNVGWRQNEQTFDAFTLVNESVQDTRLNVGYIYNVNRVFSDKSPVGNLKMSAPIFNLSYRGWRAGELTAYGYLLDFANAPASSTSTWGLRFNGNRPMGDKAKLLYAAEYATQRDYRDNPARFRVAYLSLEGGVALSGSEFRLGRELLGSDGRTGFQTPLATLHAFNGWADLFLTTPATGLRDTYASAATTLSGFKIGALYHRYRADSTGTVYGSEWDFQVVRPIDTTYAVGAKLASYRASAFGVNTDKFWVWAEARF